MVKALKFLANKSVQTEILITDRHKQIAKYVREHKPSVDHRYDVWHVSRVIMHNYSWYTHTGIKKKLSCVSTGTDCAIVVEWIKSISPTIFIGVLLQQLIVMVMTWSIVGNHSLTIFVISTNIVTMNPSYMIDQ